MALFFFLGSGGNPGTPASPGVKVTATQAGSSGAASSPTKGTVGSAVTTLRTPVPTATPASGVFVKVSYLGGFSGSYGMNGVMTKARDSGDKIYTLDNATGTVSATFQKDDGSTRHDLSVEIWNNGKAVKIGKTSDAHGSVSVSYTL